MAGISTAVVQVTGQAKRPWPWALFILNIVRKQLISNRLDATEVPRSTVRKSEYIFSQITFSRVLQTNIRKENPF